jgi:hypothetical protein
MRRRHLHLYLALLVALAGPAVAQSQSYTTEPFQDLPPTARRADSESTLQLAFVLETEIPLPGPLPGLPPRLRGMEVEIPVAGGTVVTRLEPDAQPVAVDPLVNGPVPVDAAAWVADERGRRRYRTGPDGVIEAQRRCRRCAPGWKRHWKLRVAGTTLAPPVVADGRVWFGALDNRVYCVKARNGHRVWIADLGARVSSRLVRWTGPDAEASDGESGASSNGRNLILAVPDGGSELIALDAVQGLRIASVRLGDADGRLVNGPLATADGRIVVARQKYIETEASLMVYRLRPVSAEPPASAEDPPTPEIAGPRALSAPRTAPAPR